MQTLVTKENNHLMTSVTIEPLIHIIREQPVMLDSDLAKLYGVETRRLNEQVRRNKERFPEDFMFQLTKDEFNAWKKQSTIIDGDNLKSQIATSSWGGTRYLPFVFTENGVAMLSSVLRSPIAIETNIRIMRAFTAMRKSIYSMATTDLKIELLNEKFKQLSNYIENVLRDQNDINEETSAQLELINQSLAELRAMPAPKPRKRIGFEASDE